MRDHHNFSHGQRDGLAQLHFFKDQKTRGLSYNIYPPEKFSVSLLKMILCIEVAERFANPRARAQQGLTDKVKTKKEREEMQNREDQEKAEFHCVQSQHSKTTFSHILDPIVPIPRAF